MSRPVNRSPVSRSYARRLAEYHDGVTHSTEPSDHRPMGCRVPASSTSRAGSRSPQFGGRVTVTA